MSDDMADLAGAYSLDAVDDLERARFENVLQHSPTARRDVRDFRDTAGRLAGHVAEAPPTDLRAAVLRQISETRQERPVIRRGSRLPVSRTIIGIAGAAAVAAASWFVIGVRNDGIRSDRITNVLSAPDSRTVELTGEGAMSGRLVTSDALDAAVLVLDGMPAVGDGRSYELWYIPSGEGAAPIPIDTFRPGGDGRVVARTTELRSDIAIVGVTEEPSSGSPAPTGPILLAGNVGA